jgi:hypothetical protein
VRDGGGELGAQRDGRRHDARGAALRRPLRRVERTHPEAQLVDGVAAHAQARHQLRRQHLQLVRPDAGRDLDQQDAALEAHGMRAIGDARPHRQLPLAHRDRGAPAREAVLARAIEEILHRLGRVEVLPPPALRGPGHRG